MGIIDWFFSFGSCQLIHGTLRSYNGRVWRNSDYAAFHIKTWWLILSWFTCFVQVVNLKLFCQFYKSKQKQFHVPNSYKESTVKFFSQESYQPRKLKRIKTSELVSIPYHPKLFTHLFFTSQESIKHFCPTLPISVSRTYNT